MLYLIFMRNHPSLAYRGGQGPIVHLEADLRRTVAWADERRRRWAFTLSNAGAYYFEDRCNLSQLGEIQWDAVNATDFRAPEVKEGKQAEFLLEHQFPWELISRIGVYSQAVYSQVVTVMQNVVHKPPVQVMRAWYY